MTSLPQNLAPRLERLAHVVSAYNICLKLESWLQAANGSGERGKDTIYIRILGYLLHFVPTDEGLRTVTEEITAASDDSALLSVGQMYFDHYIRPFRSNKGRTPIRSSRPSPPSFDTISDMINDDTLVEVPQSHADAKKECWFDPLLPDSWSLLLIRPLSAMDIAVL